ISPCVPERTVPPPLRLLVPRLCLGTRFLEALPPGRHPGRALHASWGNPVARPSLAVVRPQAEPGDERRHPLVCSCPTTAYNTVTSRGVEGAAPCKSAFGTSCASSTCRRRLCTAGS